MMIEIATGRSFGCCSLKVVVLLVAIVGVGMLRSASGACAQSVPQVVDEVVVPTPVPQSVRVGIRSIPLIRLMTAVGSGHGVLSVVSVDLEFASYATVKANEEPGAAIARAARVGVREGVNECVQWQNFRKWQWWPPSFDWAHAQITPRPGIRDAAWKTKGGPYDGFEPGHSWLEGGKAQEWHGACDPNP